MEFVFSKFVFDQRNICLNRIGRAAALLNKLASAKKGSRFRQNFVKVARANALAQAIVLLTTPILTRFYSPVDFGTLALFSSLLSFLLAFSTWRFDWSIPNAASRTQAAALLVLGLITLMFFSVTTFVVFWTFSPDWSFWKGFKDLRPFLLLLPIALVGSGMHQLMQAWFIREASLTAVSKTKIAQSVAGTGLNIAGGIAGLGAFGLIASSLVSAWVGIGVLFRHAYGLWASVTKLSFTRIKACWKRFWREVTFSTMVSIVNTMSLSVTPMLLVQYYSVTEVGWYALMYRLAIAPIGMFTVAIGQSFWAEAAQLVKRDRKALRSLYIKTTKRLILLSLPIISICAAGPIFVAPLFGKTEWVGAGYVLPAIIPMVFGSIVFSPTNHLIVFGKQHLQLVCDITRFLLIITALIVAKLAMFDFVTAVLLMSLSSLVGHIILFIIHIKVQSTHE